MKYWGLMVVALAFHYCLSLIVNWLQASFMEGMIFQTSCWPDAVR